MDKELIKRVEDIVAYLNEKIEEYENTDNRTYMLSDLLNASSTISSILYEYNQQIEKLHDSIIYGKRFGVEIEYFSETTKQYESCEFVSYCEYHKTYFCKMSKDGNGSLRIEQLRTKPIKRTLRDTYSELEFK